MMTPPAHVSRPRTRSKLAITCGSSPSAGFARVGDVTVSLAWSTTDDLDLHVFTPSGAEISYSNREAGGGVLDVEGVWVRDVFAEPATGWFGRGVAIQTPFAVTATELRVAHSRIERVADAGIAVFDSVGSADNVAIDGVAAAQDGTFGDGIDVFGGGSVTPTMNITRSSVFRAARAGIANFASVVSLLDSRIGCNGIDVNGESTDAVSFIFEDQGNNVCGCDTEDPCKVLTTDLAPPGVPTAPEP